ncbi:hypothetical protein X946_2407 [Burkholderia sp. ABCPW 111]|nr:hypothetical protein X946_2407 [Burkholderia sp. ABCPW 111]
MVSTASAATCFMTSGRSGWSIFTRVLSRRSCQKRFSTSAGVLMLPLRTRL